MRFLCEQCKAKYQIADEKVAGKTVRMKCRKCGHLIEVKADVTETSVATKAPPAPDPNDAPNVHEEATRVGMDVNAMMKLSSDKSKDTTTKPQAPRPGAGSPAAPKSTLATSLASAKPAARSPSRSDRPGPSSSALAGAFNKSVGKDDERAMLEISTSSEWYCAINGVPVGPVRIAELRRKAATGAVTEDSLVWQEGMEEWRPLRTVPELVAIVREGLSSERPSLVTPAPPGPPPRAPSHGHAAPQPPRAGARATTETPKPAPIAVTPAPPNAAAARSNVVSLSSRFATAEKLEPDEIADPFASKSPISGVVDPFAPVPSSAVSSSATAIPNVEASSALAAPTVVIPRKAAGPNWIVVGMVVAFGAFGAMAGFAVFFRQGNTAQPAPTIVVTQQATPTSTTPGTAVAMGTDVAPMTSDSAVARVQPTGAGGVRNNTNTTAAGTATQKAVDPSIAALLGGPGTGPNVGGGGGGGSASSALSEEAIQRVVQQRSAGVKRTCWERGGGTESNVNVRVHLSIAATGNVQNATAEGNDPIVTKCIENNVRNWQFPVSSGPTTVDIPFHFLRQ